jgi:predicted RNase H-like nuclease (RuvC/YqgF family)
MESDPVFASDDEAIRYWKQKATDSMNDFNELQEMSGDYERELDAQINRLEEEKKNSISQCKRLQDEIEKYHAKNTEREAEIDRLLKELKHETSQKVSLEMIIHSQKAWK